MIVTLVVVQGLGEEEDNIYPGGITMVIMFDGIDVMITSF